MGREGTIMRRRKAVLPPSPRDVLPKPKKRWESRRSFDAATKDRSKIAHFPLLRVTDSALGDVGNTPWGGGLFAGVTPGAS